MNAHTVKVFPPTVRGMTIVFEHYKILREFLQRGALNTPVVEKNLRCSIENAVYLDRSVSVPMTLNDPERRDARDQIFLLRSYGLTDQIWNGNTSGGPCF